MNGYANVNPHSDSASYRARLLPNLMEDIPDNGVAIYYWQAQAWDDFGHVSLLVKPQNELSVYVSFTTEHMPFSLGSILVSTLCSCCYSNLLGTFVSRHAEKRDCDAKVVLTNLNSAAIYQSAIRLIQEFNATVARQIDEEESEERITSIPSTETKTNWGIGQNQMTCASIVLDLLIIGGLDERVPIYRNLRNPRETLWELVSHVNLLALRPFFALSALLPLAYSLIVLESPSMENFSDKLAVSSIFSIGVGGTFLFEKYGLTRFPLLKSAAYRGRELVEIHPLIDSLAPLIGSLVMGVSALFYRFHPLEDNFSDQIPKIVLALFDGVLWSFLSGSIYLGTGMLTTVVLSLLNGRLIKTPHFVYRLSSYLKAIEEIPSEIIQFQLRKEKSLLFLNSLILPTVFMAHCYDDKLVNDHIDDINFQLIGSGIFLMGYLATKSRIFLIENENSTITKLQNQSNQSVMLSEKLEAQLNSNEPRPELFAFTVLASGLALLISAHELSETQSPPVILFLSMMISFFAYVLSILCYSTSYHLAHAYCPARFFQRSSGRTMQELLSSNIDPVDEDEGQQLLSDNLTEESDVTLCGV